MGMVDAARIGGKIAAAMRDDDLEPRIGVEHAAEDQMMHRHRGIERIADHVDEVVVAEAAPFGEAARMHEDEDAELLRLGEEGTEALVRQFFAGDIGADLDAAQPQRLDRVLELGDGERGCL